MVAMEPSVEVHSSFGFRNSVEKSLYLLDVDKKKEGRLLKQIYLTRTT